MKVDVPIGDRVTLYKRFIGDTVVLHIVDKSYVDDRVGTIYLVSKASHLYMESNEGHYYYIIMFHAFFWWDTVTSLAKASLVQQYFAFP